MGQMTTGLLYGVKVSWDEVSLDLLDQFETEAVPGCDDWLKNLKLRREIVPRTVDFDEESLVGYWVALALGGDDYGVPDFRSGKVCDLSSTYAEEMKRASTYWEFFAEWARQRGVEFHDPDLWIAETEVA